MYTPVQNSSDKNTKTCYIQGPRIFSSDTDAAAVAGTAAAAATPVFTTVFTVVSVEVIAEAAAASISEEKNLGP